MGAAVPVTSGPTFYHIARLYKRIPKCCVWIGQRRVASEVLKHLVIRMLEAASRGIDKRAKRICAQVSERYLCLPILN
jgi:hypothetical protein